MSLLILSCEKDGLENYRTRFAGSWDFISIRQDMTVVPPEIVDTIFFAGYTKAIYSNRDDLMYIQFTSNDGFDIIVSKGGYISLPAWRLSNSIETLEGLFNADGTELSFVYRFSIGNYSMNYRVEGSRN